MEAIEYDEQETQDQKFQDDFNSGYLLAKYNPQLLEQILFEREQESTHGLDGIKWGQWQYEEEKKVEQLKGIESVRNKSRERDKGRER